MAVRLNNLASNYYAQGKLAQSEPLVKRALAILEKTLGPEHPDVGKGLNNLADLYEAMGRQAEAAPLRQRAARIKAMPR